MLAERIRLLFALSPIALAGSTLAVALVTVALWGHQPVWPLAAWAGAVLATVSLQAAILLRHRHRPIPDGAAGAGAATLAATAVSEAALRADLRAYFVATLASGLAWSYATIALLPAGSPDLAGLVLLAAAGLAAGAIVTHAAVLPVALGFQLAVLLPLAGSRLLAGGLADLAVAGIVLLLLVLMGFGSWRYGRTIRETLQLRRDHRGLTGTLRAAEASEAALGRSLGAEIAERGRVERERAAQAAFLRGLMDGLPSPILWLDPAGRIALCNRAFRETVAPPHLPVLGRRPVELAGAPGGEAFAELDRHLQMPPDRPAAQEVRLRFADGEDRMVQLHLATLRQPDAAPGDADSGTLAVLTDLTARPATQSALRASEARFRTLVENALIGISISTPEGELLFANDACARMYGYSSPESLYTLGGWSRLLAPEDRAAAKRQAEATFTHGSAGPPVRLRGLRADGRMIWVDAQARVVQWDGRRAILSVQIDVTAAAEAGLALERRAAEVQAMLAAMPGGILMCDRDLRITLASDQVAQLYSLPPDLVAAGNSLEPAVRHRALRGDFGPGDPETAVAMHMAQLRLPDPTIVERQVADRILEIRRAPLHEGGFVSVITDVTARRQAEARLLDAVESLAEGFALYDREERLILHNARYRDLYDLSEAQLSGASFEALLAQSIARGIIDDAPYGAEGYVAARLAYRARCDGAFELQLRDGRAITIRERRTVTGDVVCIHTDVTGIRQVQAELSESTAALAALNRQKDQLFQIIAHDLRSPFNALMGYATLLAHGAADQPAARTAEQAGHVHEAASQALALLDTLLDWSRLQMRRTALVPEMLDLGEEATRWLSDATPAAERKGVSLHNTVSSLPVWADRDALATILRNLLGNAVKYTQSGGSVTLSAAPDETRAGGVTIHVADTGVGMTAAQARALLVPGDGREGGRSTAGTAGETGTGLGLLICQDLVVRHGGELGVDGRPGHGTTIRVSLPPRPDPVYTTPPGAVR